VGKQDVPCMFCGQLPCQCDGIKKRRPKSTSKAQPPVAPPSESGDDIDFSDFTSEPIQRKFKAPKRDLSLESALRNIRDIVCKEDQIAIDQELHYADTPDIKKREAEWRAKHGS